MHKVKAKILYLPHYDREWGDMKYAYEGDSGFDIRACMEADFELAPGERCSIPVGFRVQLEPGFGWTFRSRSGCSKIGLVVTAGLGTIDSGYNGEPVANMVNHSNEPISITRGMRIAQGVIEPIYQADFVEIANEGEFDERERGARGFASSGMK